MNKAADTINKKNTGTRKKRKLPFILAAVLIAGLLTGGLLAKYRSDNQKDAEMIAAQFHVSSDYLTEATPSPSYDITDCQDGFDIQLYNYEKENTALVSDAETDIKYTVKLSNISDTSDTSDWSYSDTNKGTMTGSSTKKSQSIRIIPPVTAGDGDSVRVTVKTTEPFTKTLSATFTVHGKSEPDYNIQDNGDGTVLLTIQSNNYAGAVTINWDADEYAPDNTDPQMESWSGSPKEISVEKNTTYELLFFKKSVKSITGTSGSGTSISIP